MVDNTPFRKPIAMIHVSRFSCGVLMSAQNTHHIPVFYHVFSSFHLVISVFIALFLILDFLCISEKTATFRGCMEDVATLRLDDVSIFISLTSRHR